MGEDEAVNEPAELDGEAEESRLLLWYGIKMLHYDRTNCYSARDNGR